MANDAQSGERSGVAVPVSQANAETLCRNAINLAQSTLNSSFDIARRILEIKDPNQAIELQLAHARSQIAAFDAHIRELDRLSRRQA